MEIQQYLSDLGLPPALVVLIIATMPVVELRGAIPVAINVFDFPWFDAWVLAIIGNLLPIPFILLFLRGITSFLSRHTRTRKMVDWVFTRTRKRSAMIEKYKYVGLTGFVSIPLPMTGAWTGSIAAVLLDLPFYQALGSITLGVLFASIIVVSLSLLGWAGGIIAALALLSAFFLQRNRRKP
ncbi:putative small multi-drug export [Dehalogenimonas lykanthroporepellens BL-DC-9]|jgi:uncharacterized membrane protein|nr:putative small multi-drug export [Dehalogenimonas lykanthroporepellens BL-DC-9]